MRLDGGVHLTYCSNIHPGESWPEVRANLEHHLLAVRERLRAAKAAPTTDFGIGLRLSAMAAAELARPAVLAEFRDFMAANGLYVFTINGFPYGRFHGHRVKEEVYLPDWRDPERLRYTDQLADLLAALLPDDAGLEGSVSSVPGAFKPAMRGAADVAAMVEHLLRHVAHLVELRRRSGRLVALALEPEPHCFLETIDEVIAFFQAELRSAAAIRRTAALAGLDAALAERALHDHLGVCLDLCHAAVEFESLTDGVQRLADAGIRVPKMQISAGLRVPLVDAQALAALRGFDDPVYLHQVVQRGPAGLQRHADLPEAFAALDPGFAEAREWRVHYHVPVFRERLGPFSSTQDFVREALAMQRAQAVSRHLEVETYTWDVLPERYRKVPVDEAVARELAWVIAELEA